MPKPAGASDVKVHLVRHGQSTWNLSGRLQGQTAHPDLTALGREQAALAAGVLASRVGGAVELWSSDLVRATRTAEVISARLRSPVRLDEALREQGLGSLEGRVTSALRPQPTPDGMGVGKVRWGGGESTSDVYARVDRFLRRVLPTAPANLVLVSHGDTIRVMAAWLRGRSHREVDWDTPVANGSVLTLAASTRLSSQHRAGQPWFAQRRVGDHPAVP